MSSFVERSPKRAKLDSDVQAVENNSTPLQLSADARVVENNLEIHELAPEVFIKLTVSWSGKTFPVELGESDR